MSEIVLEGNVIGMSIRAEIQVIESFREFAREAGQSQGEFLKTLVEKYRINRDIEKNRLESSDTQSGDGDIVELLLKGEPKKETRLLRFRGKLLLGTQSLREFTKKTRTYVEENFRKDKLPDKTEGGYQYMLYESSDNKGYVIYEYFAGSLAGSQFLDIKRAWKFDTLEQFKMRTWQYMTQAEIERVEIAICKVISLDEL